MDTEELKTLIAQMLREMAPGTEPAVKASEYKPTVPGPQEPTDAGEVLDDIADIDLRRQYLVEAPADREGYLRLKSKTPARLGVGRAGPRYKTITLLRFRADHAAAQDSVFSQVPEEFYKSAGLVYAKTQCRDKDEYLTRPDLGRRFDPENEKIIREALPKKPRVQLVIGDGLSSAAVTVNALDCAQAIAQGLNAYGIELGKTLFVQYCRVGAGDAVGDITGCELVCVLIGERPGLVTSESMSAYLTYAPHKGIAESKRTVVSNIHRQGTPSVEAGAHIAGLIQEILTKKASGVDLLEAGQV